MRAAFTFSLVVMMWDLSAAWTEMLTTFPKFNSHPDNRTAAEDEHWLPVSICRNGCSGSFTGNRFVQPSNNSADPELIIIFDTNGEPAGMQSLVPANNFVGWDCEDNDFYVKETVRYFDIEANDTNTKEFCMTTMYFTNPIHEPNVYEQDQLILQKGRGINEDNLVKIPTKYEEAKEDKEVWNTASYFPGMGHHMLPNKEEDFCTKAMPIQTLYAYKDGECGSSGFVWTHINVNNEGNGWEKVTMPIVKAIAGPVTLADCFENAVNNGLVRTMHVFLNSTTDQCQS